MNKTRKEINLAGIHNRREKLNQKAQEYGYPNISALLTALLKGEITITKIQRREE